MIIQPALEVPHDLLAKLIAGQLRRTGGVLRVPAGLPGAGQIAAHLRDVCITPQPLATFGALMPPALAGLLGVVGTVSSVATLGATVAFGVKTMRRLAQIDNAMRGMQSSVADLAWAVDVGLRQTQAAIADLKGRVDATIYGGLHSAAEMAWTAQSLEPNSAARVARTENALQTASHQAHALALIAGRDAEQLANKLQGRILRSSKIKDLNEYDIVVVKQCRSFVAAKLLVAKLLAEASQLDHASLVAEEAASRARSWAQDIARAVLLGDDVGAFLYPVLLSASAHRHGIRAAQVGRWAELFDQTNPGLSYVMDFMAQSEPRLALDLLKWEVAEHVKLSILNDVMVQLEGLAEDADRAEGHAHEFRFAFEHGLSIEQYRARHRVGDEIGEAPVAILTPS